MEHKFYDYLVVKKSDDLSEYNILKMLNHPNIINPVDYIVECDSEELEVYYIILPKLKKLTHVPTLEQVEQLLSALEYLALLGFYNSDIHIDNIMEQDGKLILIDFGYCKKSKKSYDTLIDIYKNNLAYSILYFLIEQQYQDMNVDEYDNIYEQQKKNKFREYGKLGYYLYSLL